MITGDSPTSNIPTESPSFPHHPSYLYNTTKIDGYQRSAPCSVLRTPQPAPRAPPTPNTSHTTPHRSRSRP
ncbi:hypothetical protein BO94DRAFT_126386 [Aspergillus sclerotioniger CBS 115572]|uniref:Uncharacterized protein n=1 Tax=Aspergillus sclerotioniger CBS 115572 TaxID=1450535 RepID=A0A317XD23_9EURO|nr:hypothetical protein BO94DRAFT_126386 [Aspergillus sclerotioniger CBS 115572]PWY95487.1 hypothetical protein BO94DRAFT_126386 [Aspergillus sclerotioniger CBS 115572]